MNLFKQIVEAGSCALEGILTWPPDKQGTELWCDSDSANRSGTSAVWPNPNTSYCWWTLSIALNSGHSNKDIIATPVLTRCAWSTVNRIRCGLLAIRRYLSRINFAESHPSEPTWNWSFSRSAFWHCHSRSPVEVSPMNFQRAQHQEDISS